MKKVTVTVSLEDLQTVLDAAAEFAEMESSQNVKAAVAEVFKALLKREEC